MKYRLKVRVSKKMWKTGLVVYDTILEAENRQRELKEFGIESIIIDEFGSKLRK